MKKHVRLKDQEQNKLEFERTQRSHRNGILERLNEGQNSKDRQVTYMLRSESLVTLVDDNFGRKYRWCS